MTGEGAEHPHYSAGKPSILETRGTESGTVGMSAPQLPADLAAVVAAWATLPPAIRAGIVAMVQASGGKA